LLTKSVALGAAGVVLLTACGGSTTKAQPAGPQPSSVSGTVDSASSPSGAPTSATDVAAVDVCATLSQADAADVARARGLNGAQTAKTVYTLTKKKQVDTGSTPTSSCEFSIDGQGASGTVVIQVMSADHFDMYAVSGDKVNGLGDEAYSDGGSTVVRVGGLMLATGENSFGNDFVVALYRKIIPHLN